MSRKPTQMLVGRRVKLIRCNDVHTKIEPGTLGTVESVDDAGTVHVAWDDGQHLGLVWDDGDRWNVVNQ